MDTNLSQQAFQQKVLEMLSLGEYEWVVECRQSDGVRPVGVILAHGLPDGRRIEPHVDWFPWATPRNRVEGLVGFLIEVSKRFKILVYSTEAERNFWERMKSYGILRHGCKVWDHFSRGEHAFFFYTTGL